MGKNTAASLRKLAQSARIEESKAKRQGDTAGAEYERQVAEDYERRAERHEHDPGTW